MTFGLIFMLLVACIGTVSANIVSNGDFESPIANYPFTTYYAGNTFGSWHVDSGSIDLIHDYWQAYAGDQSIDLAGETPGAVSQTLATVPGKTYTLTFWMAGNPDYQSVKTLGISWNGADLPSTYTFDSTGHSHTDMGWTKVTITNLEATSASTVLTFKDIGKDQCYGIALDNISVDDETISAPEFPGVAVPVAMLAAILGIVFCIRKKNP